METDMDTAGEQSHQKCCRCYKQIMSDRAIIRLRRDVGTTRLLLAHRMIVVEKLDQELDRARALCGMGMIMVVIMITDTGRQLCQRKDKDKDRGRGKGRVQAQGRMWVVYWPCL